MIPVCYFRMLLHETHKHLLSGECSSPIILSAIYMLYLYKRIIFGIITNEKLKNILDLNWREKAIMLPLIIVVILIGIFPNIFLEPMRLPIENIINNYEIANGK